MKEFIFKNHITGEIHIDKAKNINIANISFKQGFAQGNLKSWSKAEPYIRRHINMTVNQLK